MGAFIAKQPNGLYCRFSEVVDNVTHYNMTEEDYIEMCVEKAKEKAYNEAVDTLKHWVRPFEDVKNSFVPSNGTIDEFNGYLKEMGDEEGLSEERIKELKEEYLHE